MIDKLNTDSQYNLMLPLRLIQNGYRTTSLQLAYFYLGRSITTAEFGNEKIHVQPYSFIIIKSNSVKWIYCIIYFGALFFQGIKC